MWNDRFLIENACSRGDAVAFHGLFSVCDEAFLLALLVKHAERWSAWMPSQLTERAHFTLLCSILPFKKLRIWTEDDEPNTPARCRWQPRNELIVWSCH